MEVLPILTSLASNRILWHQVCARQATAGSPHADTQTIFLRWSDNLSIESAFTDLEAIDYPALNAIPEARQLLAIAAKAAGAEVIGRMIIVSLKPGGKISPHADEGPYADFYERFHCVLQSDHGNRFMVGGKTVYETCEMRPGDLWWFNHKRTHWVENNSNRERIHMIMDMVAPHFRVEREH